MYQTTSIIFAIISIALFVVFIGVGFTPQLNTGQREHLKAVLISAALTGVISIAFMFTAQISLGTVG